MEIQAYSLLRLVTLFHRRLLSHQVHPLKEGQPNPAQDALLLTSNSLVSASDDMVSSLYIPQDVENFKFNANAVFNLVEELSTQIEKPEDEKNRIWLDGCMKQIKNALDALAVS